MNLTMREELTILSLCFIFSALTIPIVIVTSNEYRHPKINSNVDLTPMKVQPIWTYRDKALISSIQIIEEFSKNRTNSSEQLTFTKLLNMKPYELREKLTAIKTSRMTQKNIESDIWRHFSFQNGTLLTSKSFKMATIPLTVDWYVINHSSIMGLARKG